MTPQEERVVIAVMRTLGFVGNMHYCSGCLNHFHDDCGQHKPDCPVLADMVLADGWWEELEVRLK